jgi:hypothetical protein
MLHEFLNRKAAKWASKLEQFFLKYGVSVEGVTTESAVIHYSNGAESLLGAVRATLWLSVAEAALWLGTGIVIGRLIQ